MRFASKTALVTAALTIGLASVGAAAPASASEGAPPSAISHAQWAAIDAALDQQTGVFDGAVARAAGASTEVVDEFATGWASSGRSVKSATVDPAEESRIASTLAETRCAGKSRWDYTGLQANVYVNSCDTSRILSILGGGAGAAAIAAAIVSATGVGAVIAGAIAGVLAVTGGMLGACAANGRGIVLHNIPPSAYAWCTGQ